MKKIQLTRGRFALVDDADYENLSKYRWCFAEGYAIRASKVNGRKTTIKMHRVIMNAPSGVEVDHINGDKIDNRKANLRLCSHGDNAKNRLMSRANTSGFKGVSFNKRDKKWNTRIYVNGKYIHLGYFKDIRVAAEAFNVAALRHRGKFASIN